MTVDEELKVPLEISSNPLYKQLIESLQKENNSIFEAEK